jgi:hypothetical protein
MDLNGLSIIANGPNPQLNNYFFSAPISTGDSKTGGKIAWIISPSRNTVFVAAGFSLR